MPFFGGGNGMADTGQCYSFRRSGFCKKKAARIPGQLFKKSFLFLITGSTVLNELHLWCKQGVCCTRLANE